MNFLPITTEREARHFNRLPVIAVDLGFSGRNRTTGVAWSPSSSSHSEATKHQFGEAVTEVANLIRPLREVVLVLEAPLSSAFNGRGNPRPRGQFEREPHCRWWSVGSGAATALSALFFLRQLHCKLESSSVTIHLVEGFVSGDDSGDHDKVADVLCQGFRGKHNRRWHSVSEDGSVISALDWLNCKAPHHPPVILQPD